MVARHAAGDGTCDPLATFVRAGGEAGGQEQQFPTEVRDQALRDVTAEDVDQPMPVRQCRRDVEDDAVATGGSGGSRRHARTSVRAADSPMTSARVWMLSGRAFMQDVVSGIDLHCCHPAGLVNTFHPLSNWRAEGVHQRAEDG